MASQQNLTPQDSDKMVELRRDETSMPLGDHRRRNQLVQSGESFDEDISDEEGSSSDDSTIHEQFEDEIVIESHPSYQQVILDVNRCAGRLEHIRQCYFHRTDDDGPAEDLSGEPEESGTEDSLSLSAEPTREERIDRLKRDLQCQRRLKKKLARLIVTLLIRKPERHYYQGFHDVCLTYMTVYGEDLALKKLDKIVDSHFSQFMQPTMLETQEFLALIPIIIGLHDSKVQDFLERSEVGTVFALSWTITWFSHVIPNEHDVETIFSFLEKFEDPYVILYLCATIVIYKKDMLLKLEPEMSTVHHFLCQFPRKEKLPINDLLHEAETAFRKWPPQLIRRKLHDHRRTKLQLHNYNLVQSLTQRFIPSLTDLVVSSSSRTALVVFVLASALAFQWTR